MNYMLPQPPAVISSMKRLEEEYALLTRRRSTLLGELRDNSEHSRALKKLRQSELKRLDTHLAKIERFLNRYGFIENEKKVYHGSLKYST